MSDFVYLALTLLSFAGLALLVGVLESRLEPDPHDLDPTDPDLTDPADPDAGSDAGREAGTPATAVRR